MRNVTKKSMKKHDLLPITVLDWEHSITHTSRSCIVVDRVIYGKHDAHVDIIRIPFRVRYWISKWFEKYIAVAFTFVEN